MTKNKITITHVNLATDFKDSEQQTLLLIEELRTRKIHQQIVVRAHSKLHRHCKLLDYAEIIAITKPLAFFLPRASKSDLLHAHENHAAYWCHLAKKLYGTPYLISCHTSNRPKNNPVTRSVYNQATCLISPSRFITEVLHSYQPDLPIDLIPYMFHPSEPDETAVKQLRRKYKGKYLIGHTGDLICKDKGQDYLIEAARKLVSHYPHMRFILLGEGKDEAKLRQQAQNIDQVEFITDRTNLRNYLAIFDQFVFPALHESLGGDLIPAMHLRLPVVASAVAGVTDLIQDRVTGLLVPSKSSTELAQAIEAIYKSPSMASKLGQQASMTSKRHSRHDISDKVFAIYQGILALRH